MSDARDQLLALLRIQELAQEVQAARAIVESAPARIEEIEGRFRERNAEYVALRDRYDALEKDRRGRTVELDALQDGRKKYMEALMQVKNQREYAAVLKELDAVKSQIATHEEAILKDMEELETLKTDLDARAGHIEQERAIVEREHEQVAAAAREGEERIARCERERQREEAELPADLVESVRRIEEGRQGLFLVRAEKELCQACYVRVRPQVFQEIKQALRLHLCSNCHRYLYYEPALRPSGGEPSLPETGSQGAEAVNGGAV